MSARFYLLLEELQLQHDNKVEAGHALYAGHGNQSGSSDSSSNQRYKGKNKKRGKKRRRRRQRPPIAPHLLVASGRQPLDRPRSGLAGVLPASWRRSTGPSSSVSGPTSHDSPAPAPASCAAGAFKFRRLGSQRALQGPSDRRRRHYVAERCRLVPRHRSHHAHVVKLWTFQHKQ
ncbi:hypothetical protein PAHAL_2G400500 [Panicum hallii]|uniref:Uncharacterized protein n=1 Tax=Panicum hallii TaxID=206008 RepID=A0A2T8KS71_9POAL|nr:uncharacterized protein LOC112881403 [Panicum hallii]PVH65009.1 hypothetical protein PAHAL_2G400500 [Panicum hallii]